jgi:hypothetical protein
MKPESMPTSTNDEPVLTRAQNNIAKVLIRNCGDEQLWRLYRYIPRDDDFWINIVQGARLGDL